MSRTLQQIYPWVKLPLIVSAPMLGAATPSLAMSVQSAGGIGFLAGGVNAANLSKQFEQVRSLLPSNPSPASPLPIGVGFQLFNSPLDPLVEVIAQHRPAIIWLFAPKEPADLQRWAAACRAATDNQTQIWVQVGSVREAKEAIELAAPDVLVAQGCDAGGHGQVRSASVISLVPEVSDLLTELGKSEIPVLAAGGIVDARGMRAALALGATGVVMGTRFLAAREAGIASGWKAAVVNCEDGGRMTTRSTLCDRLKETKGWPAIYDGRAILNQGHVDEAAGMADEENVRLYQAELQTGDEKVWGPQGRMVAYAGTGVGLIKDIEPAAAIVERVLAEVAGSS